MVTLPLLGIGPTVVYVVSVTILVVCRMSRVLGVRDNQRLKLLSEVVLGAQDSAGTDISILLRLSNVARVDLLLTTPPLVSFLLR